MFKTEFELDMEKMEPLKIYNVEEANIGILAYDEAKEENVYSKIISCIRKPLTDAIAIKIEGRSSFEEAVSDKHMYAVYLEDSKIVDYAYAKDLKRGCQVYTLDGFKKIVDIQKREREDWFDVQTETGNYYANGILSHNSPMAHLNAITGGMAVNFYPSTRFRVSAREPITRNGEMVGIKIKIKNYKNKTGIPNRECLLDLYFHDGPDYKAGIDGEGQYLDMALELGLITQHGAWYYYRENDPNPENLVKCQGWGGLQTWFKENKDEFEKIKIEIDAKMSGYDEILDKNSVEVDEAEAIKQEAIETAKRKAANTEKLAEEAMASSEESSSEAPAEVATE